jgi:hypothetical protein
LREQLVPELRVHKQDLLLENKHKIYSSNKHQNSGKNNKTTRLLLQDNPTVCHCAFHATTKEEEASFF